MGLAWSGIAASVSGGERWMCTAAIPLLGCLLLAAGAPVVWGEGPVVSRDCAFVWDAVADRRVVRYRLYVSRQPGAYGFGKPTLEVPATTTMVACARLKLRRPGQYYAVVTAVDRAGHESPPSNELAFVSPPPQRRRPRKARP
jgi:hypothetical protein